MNRFIRLWRYRRRLAGLSLPGKLSYIANLTHGEILRRRSVGTAGLRMVEISLTGSGFRQIPLLKSLFVVEAIHSCDPY